MERWKVRWLWTAGPRVPINSIGFQTSTFVDNINGNPDSVALMADITSLVGVGDVLLVDWDRGMRPVIVELKSGATNGRIVSLVEAHQADIEKVPPHEFEEIGPQARKHFARVARQTEREQNFESIANNDTGKDPETGAYFQNIGTEAMGLDIYDPSLDAMMSAAAKAGSVIECIDGCLWMGVYYRASLQDEPWQELSPGNYEPRCLRIVPWLECSASQHAPENATHILACYVPGIGLRYFAWRRLGSGVHRLGRVFPAGKRQGDQCQMDNPQGKKGNYRNFRSPGASLQK